MNDISNRLNEEICTFTITHDHVGSQPSSSPELLSPFHGVSGLRPLPTAWLFETGRRLRFEQGAKYESSL